MANKKLTDLATLSAALTTWVASANANGILGKVSIDQLKTIINVAANITINTATPSTNPGPAVGNRMWVAATAGTYTNFAGIVLATGEVAFLVDTGSTYSKVTLPFDFTAATALLNSILTTSGVQVITSDGPMLINGFSLDATGAAVPTSAYYVSDFFDCLPGQVWQYKGVVGTTAMAACAYDSNNVFLSTILGGNTSSNTAFINATVPAGATKIRFGFRNSTGDNQEVIGPRLVAEAAVQGLATIKQSISLVGTLLNTILQESGDPIITDDGNMLTSGLYLDSSGNTQAASPSYVSGFFKCRPGQIWQYKGSTGSTAMAVVGYTAAGVFTQVLLGGNTSSNGAFTNVTVPAGTYQLRFGFRNNAGDPQQVLAARLVDNDQIEGWAALQTTINTINTTLNSFAGQFDYGTTPVWGFVKSDGYIDDTGSSGNYWYNSGFVPVAEGQVVRWRGNTGNITSAVYGYDADKVPYANLLPGPQTSSGQYINVTIPAGVKFVRATFRIEAGTNYSFIATKYDNTLFIENLPPYYVPPKIWTYTAERTRLYATGCVATHPVSTEVDALFFYGQSYQRQLDVQFQAANNDVALPFTIRDKKGDMQTVGTSVLKITHTTQSPAAARNIIAIGDSTTRTTANAGIHGLWINEVSRRLTGVGTAAIASPQPAALALTNLYFRGTLGDQPIKHEGRGGWGFNTYLNSASAIDDTNAFWDGTKFSINFYLNANNFLAAQTTGGVDSTGSNLTVLIQLGWNHAFMAEPQQVKVWAMQMIDSIHAEKPNAHIKLIGMAPPPALGYAASTARGHATPQSIMREVIIALGRVYGQIAADPAYSSFVEYIHVGAQFGPEGSFLTTNQPLHNRTTATQVVATDYVHCNAVGYAQVADAVFYNLLYNYCRLT